MAWKSKFNSASSKLLVRQLMAIIQRDQRAALDNVGGAGVLPSIVGYYFSQRAIKQFPSVMLRVDRTQWKREESPFTRLGEHRVICAIAAEHQNPEACAELVDDYMEALEELFESIGLADFQAPLSLTHPMLDAITTAGLQTMQVHSVIVQDSNYAGIGRTPNGFAIAGVITIEIETEEDLNT